MKNNTLKFFLEEHNEDFEYQKSKSNLDIQFNRIAFIFFIFFLISSIYSIHLLHLGLRKSKIININESNIINKLHRADIVDRNDNFLAKTVSSIDVGINPVEVINKKKLLLNLKYIFPNKNYEIIEKNLKKNKFFWFEKKI